jgi:hypothetical protein
MSCRIIPLRHGPTPAKNGRFIVKIAGIAGKYIGPRM